MHVFFFRPTNCFACWGHGRGDRGMHTVRIHLPHLLHLISRAGRR